MRQDIVTANAMAESGYVFDYLDKSKTIYSE